MPKCLGAVDAEYWDLVLIAREEFRVLFNINFFQCIEFIAIGSGHLPFIFSHKPQLGFV